MIAPPEHEQTINFNSTWDKPTDPNAPGYVNPAAPYTYTSTTNGTTTNVSTQQNNPANYVGWSNEQISYMFASNPNDLPDLVSSASRTRYTDESQGITWQGYLLGGDLVPSLGWRKDKVTNYQTNALPGPEHGLHEPEATRTTCSPARMSRARARPGAVFITSRSRSCRSSPAT